MSNDNLPDVPEPTLEEQLMDQINILTNNQNALIRTINELKAKNEDPLWAFRTPDPIKNLPTFDGNKKETNAWLEDAENTLGLFERYKGQAVYDQLVRAVKNKIIGEAKEILIAAGNPNRWEEIKEVINNSYGDRRDLTSHIQSLFYINQGKKSLSEFYNKIKTIDTAIKSTAATMDDYKHSLKAINSLVSLMTLTRFIDGLTDDLSMHVRSYRPESLEEAYSITTQYANAAYRQKLNKKSAYDNAASNIKQANSNTNNNNSNPRHSKSPYTFNNNINKTNAIPSTSNSSPHNPKTHGSAKFKTRAAPLDDDVSMRTARSRTEFNNNETEREPSNIEPDTLQQLDDSILDSDDDDYFVDDELNFQMGEVPQRKT